MRCRGPRPEAGPPHVSGRPACAPPPAAAGLGHHRPRPRAPQPPPPGGSRAERRRREARRQQPRAVFPPAGAKPRYEPHARSGTAVGPPGPPVHPGRAPPAPAEAPLPVGALAAHRVLPEGDDGPVVLDDVVVVLAIWGQRLGRTGHWRTREAGNRPRWAGWGGRAAPRRPARPLLAPTEPQPAPHTPAPRTDRACRPRAPYTDRASRPRALPAPHPLLRPRQLPPPRAPGAPRAPHRPRVPPARAFSAARSPTADVAAPVAGPGHVAGPSPRQPADSAPWPSAQRRPWAGWRADLCAQNRLPRAPRRLAGSETSPSSSRFLSDPRPNCSCAHKRTFTPG